MISHLVILLVGNFMAPWPLPPYDIYRDQLTSLFHGHALWEPGPITSTYEHVSIGDVGYVRTGRFVRMFNVLLPWDDPVNNKLGRLEPYEMLDIGPFANVAQSKFARGDYKSRYVTAFQDTMNFAAAGPHE